MVRGLYTAYTGMKTQAEKMDTIANNMANVNTTGFKRDDVIIQSFKDIYMVKINDPEKPFTENIGKMNSGVRLQGSYTVFNQGAVNQTNDSLNIALEGDGFLTVGVLDSQGNTVERYTRNGVLSINNNRELVTVSGQPILGENGKIVVPIGDLIINDQGQVSVDEVVIDKLKLANFEDLQTLKKIGNDMFEATESAVLKPFEGNINQGFLEASNVNTVKEMIDMINVNRNYEANQKVITAYDATLDKAVNEIGRV